MSNDNATQMINRQIAFELEKLNAFMTDEEDKPAIIQRIAELKAMVDSPSTQSPPKTPPPTARELIADLIQAIRHR